MASADNKLKAAIDESLAPRRADHQAYLAYADLDAMLIERAELLYVWDQYRTQYLDFAALRYPVGHAHPKVRAAVSEQLAHYGAVGRAQSTITRWPIEYAAMLCGSLGAPQRPLQIVYYPDDDAAFSAAMAMAQQLTHRVFLKGKFDRINDTNWDDQAALVLRFIDPHTGEPVDPYQAQTYADAAKQGGALVIADETITGLGRVGTMWGQQRWNIDADITIIGSGAGGGFPFGAVVASADSFAAARELMVAEERYPQLPPASAAHPAICAAGAATFTEINPGLLEHVDDAGVAMHDALASLVVQFPEVLVDSRGAGLVQNVRAVNAEVASKLVANIRSRGLLTGPARGDLIWLTPPLIISENEVRRGVDMIAEACLDWTQ